MLFLFKGWQVCRALKIRGCIVKSGPRGRLVSWKHGGPANAIALTRLSLDLLREATAWCDGPHGGGYLLV